MFNSIHLAAVAGTAFAFFAADHHLAAPKTWNNPDEQLFAAKMSELEMGRPLRKVSLGAMLALSPLMLSGSYVAPSQCARALCSTVVLFLLWLGASLMWAGDRRLAVRRYGAYLGIACAGFGAGAHLGVSVAATAGSLICGVYLTLGLFNELRCRGQRHSWRFAGTLHPNQQGVNCSLMFICLLEINPFGMLLLCTLLVVVGVCLLATRSRSAVGALAVSLISALIVKDTALPYSLRFAIVLLCPTIIMIVSARLLRFDVVGRIVSLGRPPAHLVTLTGRRALWIHLLRFASRRRWHGWGYGTFWTSKRMRVIERRSGWRFADAHSAYIDLLLSAGGVGVTLYGLMLLFLLANGLAVGGSNGLFLTVMASFVIVQSFGESTFAVPNFFSFALFVSIGTIFSS